MFLEADLPRAVLYLPWQQTWTGERMFNLLWTKVFFLVRDFRNLAGNLAGNMAVLSLPWQQTWTGERMFNLLWTGERMFNLLWTKVFFLVRDFRNLAGNRFSRAPPKNAHTVKK
jgi:hypothetical protein